MARPPDEYMVTLAKGDPERNRGPFTLDFTDNLTGAFRRRPSILGAVSRGSDEQRDPCPGYRTTGRAATEAPQTQDHLAVTE
jgi:hypothetical protein